MSSSSRSNDPWPALTLEGWRETYETLHMWTQVVGKLCLAMTPLVNHYWNLTARVHARGLLTPPLLTGRSTLSMLFDFVEHRLVIESSDGGVETIALQPRTVADFYAAVMQSLRRFGVDPRIRAMPVEVPDPIRFDTDVVHRAYDPEWANAYWRAVLSMYPVLQRFRARFIGKCSPVQFFWGAFDFAVTRFSGRRAPERPGADAMTREAYSHEVISHGFWPGSGPVRAPSFYAYAAPEPDGFRTARMRPDAAYYSNDFGEFLLPYDAVRTAASPAAELEAFLESTYDVAADRAHWNRSELER
jgi:hypothetical protein